MTAQTWDPDRYARNAGFVAELGMPVVELLAPQAGERILDIGCGDGALTEKLVAMGCDVVGIDASAEQVAAARKRGLDARQIDCRQLAFDREFDAAFSNAVLHWVKEPDAVIAGVARALRPGGRFVGEFGGSDNVARICRGLSDALAARGLEFEALCPWYYPTDEEYAERLRGHGFRIDSIALIPRPTKLPGDLLAWLETFGESFTSALPPKERRAFLEDVQERLRPELCDAEGCWTADYVRLRFAATLIA